MSRPERIRRIAGSARPLVLILTNERDVSADWVVRELRRRSVPYLRLNTERLPLHQVVANPPESRWQLQRDGTVHELDWVRGIWFRRPETPSPEHLEGLSPSELDVAGGQWRGVISGLQSLLGVKWINPPERNALAETKALQLALASSIGFRVPSTRITNSRAEVLAFLADYPKGAVVKAIHAPLIRSDGEAKFIYTERLTPDLLDGMREVEPVPFIIQEEICPKLDVRVTIVEGNAMAACLVDPSPDVDWRATKPSGGFRQFNLPDEVSALCVRLVSEMGLCFGAIDLVEDEHGNWFFLEINPNGEWGWLQKTTDLPIAEAITNALLG